MHSVAKGLVSLVTLMDNTWVKIIPTDIPRISGENTKGTLQGISRYNVESQNMRAHTGEKPYKWCIQPFSGSFSQSGNLAGQHMGQNYTNWCLVKDICRYNIDHYMQKHKMFICFKIISTHALRGGMLEDIRKYNVDNHKTFRNLKRHIRVHTGVSNSRFTPLVSKTNLVTYWREAI